MAIADLSLIENLEPIARLSVGRKKELAAICFIEKVNQALDPMRMNVAKSAQALYLIKGELELRYENGKVKLTGGSEAAKHAINADEKVIDSIALTDIQILRIDTDLLDIMMTWDQLSNNDVQAKKPQTNKNESTKRTVSDWMNDTEVFSAFNLQSGLFSRLPAANVEEMFKRMECIKVAVGQVIIQQGGVGDYYYLIQSGTAEVTRVIDPSQPVQVLAELVEGGAFGEEALVSDNKRNATVTMKSDGELLRLNKQDFVALLKVPIVNQISMPEAQDMVSNGAVWIDVRLPSEYKHGHINGALNLPLNEIRQSADSLDKNKEYILYCQTGRRSAAAAFLLAQAGLKVYIAASGVQAKR